MRSLDILFWACLFLGGGYTLFTLLMGGFSHAIGHAAHLGDMLHVGHVPELLQHHQAGATHGGITAHESYSGHADGTQHHADAHQQAEAEGGRFNLFQYLNPLSVAGFLLGFGGAGIASGLLMPSLAGSVRVLSGVISGWGLWLVAYLIVTRMFGGAEGTSHNRREDLIGTRAKVSVSISGSNPGMVSYVVAGTRQSLRAVTEDDEPIPVGAEVRIRRITDGTACVMRIDAPDTTGSRIQ